MEQPKHSAEYRRLVSSAAWRERRRALIAEVNFTCERCRRVAPDYSVFEIHHLTYERLGRERREDLEVLCKSCHSTADVQRAEATRRRCARALDDARLDGWAAKVYGEDWALSRDPEQVAEQFDAWLDSRSDY